MQGFVVFCNTILWSYDEVAAAYAEIGGTYYVVVLFSGTNTKAKVILPFLFLTKIQSYCLRNAGYPLKGIYTISFA